MIDVKGLRQLELAATEGPWYTDLSPDAAIRTHADTDGWFCIYDEGGHSKEDAELIAAMRNALTELLDEVDRLQGVRELVAEDYVGSSGLTDAEEGYYYAMELVRLRAEGSW